MLKSQACSPEERNYRLSQKRYYLFLTVGTLLFLVLLLASTVSGNYKTSVGAAFKSLIIPDYNGQIRSIILLSRFPRMLAAILIGAALSVSGLAYQDVFTNYMASPDILGVSSGSGFGASVAILLGLGYGSVCAFAFVGGMLTVCVTVSVSKLFGRENGFSVALVLSGIVVSGLMNSAIGLMKYLSNDAQLSSITYWLLGALYHVNYQELLIAAPMIAASLIVLYLYRWQILLLRNGAEDAQSHGIRAKTVRNLAIALSTLMTAVSVSVGGSIGWIGLAIPNMVKMALRDDAKYAMPLTILYGIDFTLICDLLARTLTLSEIPIGIITGVLGAVVFLLILTLRRRCYEA